MENKAAFNTVPNQTRALCLLLCPDAAPSELKGVLPALEYTYSLWYHRAMGREIVQSGGAAILLYHYRIGSSKNLQRRGNLNKNNYDSNMDN